MMAARQEDGLVKECVTWYSDCLTCDIARRPAHHLCGGGHSKGSQPDNQPKLHRDE